MKSSAPTLVVAAVVATALVLAGCSAVNPLTTQNDYSASDGLHTDIGDVRAMNLLLVTAGGAEPAVLTGTLVNSGAEDATIEFSIDGTEFFAVTVPGRGTLSLGVGAGEEQVVGVTPARPGLIAQLTIAADATDTFTTPVPIVDGTLPEYAALLDDIPAIEASVEPSPEPSPASAATPSPEPSPAP